MFGLDFITGKPEKTIITNEMTFRKFIPMQGRIERDFTFEFTTAGMGFATGFKSLGFTMGSSSQSRPEFPTIMPYSAPNKKVIEINRDPEQGSLLHWCLIVVVMAESPIKWHAGILLPFGTDLPVWIAEPNKFGDDQLKECARIWAF